MAALKLGWPQIKDEFPDVSPTWFAANHALYDGLEITDGKLAATSQNLIDEFEYTSGGLRAIGADYSLYLICGLNLAPQSAIILRKQYWSRHGGTIPTSVFQTEFPAAIEEELRKSQSTRVLKMLRAITKAPIDLIATPRPHGTGRVENMPAEVAAGRNRLLADAFESACRRIAEESDAVFLPQPAETLNSDNALSSKSAFAARSSADPDRGHKNAAYGAIVLREALDAARLSVGSFRHAVR